MLKARRFSLSTKFILFAVVLELILITGVLYTAYSYLGSERVQSAQQMLQADVDLIAKQVELERNEAPLFHFAELGLSNTQSYQVVEDTGRVVYDSQNPRRVQKQAMGAHTLLDLAKRSGRPSGVEEFMAPQTTEPYLGAYRRSLDQYYVLGALPIASIQIDLYQILEKFLLLGFLFSGISFLAIVIFSIRIIRPIRSLTSAARRMSEGHFDVQIASTSSDEIGILSEAFSIMAGRVQELLKEEIQKIRIEKEVHSVAGIQQSLLPAESIDTDRFSIEGYYKSATETGGDYWGYFETDRYLVTYVADATGHGLPSAMLTAAARGCFSAIRRFAIENPQLTLMPSQLLRLANEAVLDSAQEELNMTMFVAVYDFDFHTLYYSNAAHYPAWIIRGDDAIPRIEILQGSGPRLGESIEFESPEDKSTVLSDQDILFLYTDGLLDCTNESEEAFGKPRTKEVLVEAASQSRDLKEIKNRLTTTVNAFLQERSLSDDITYAFVKRKS